MESVFRPTRFAGIKASEGSPENEIHPNVCGENGLNLDIFITASSLCMVQVISSNFK
jgi:hypothetical protein